MTGVPKRPWLNVEYQAWAVVHTKRNGLTSSFYYMMNLESTQLVTSVTFLVYESKCHERSKSKISNYIHPEGSDCILWVKNSRLRSVRISPVPIFGSILLPRETILVGKEALRVQHTHQNGKNCMQKLISTHSPKPLLKGFSHCGKANWNEICRTTKS